MAQEEDPAVQDEDLEEAPEEALAVRQWAVPAVPWEVRGVLAPEAPICRPLRRLPEGGTGLTARADAWAAPCRL